LRCLQYQLTSRSPVGNEHGARAQGLVVVVEVRHYWRAEALREAILCLQCLKSSAVVDLLGRKSGGELLPVDCVSDSSLMVFNQRSDSQQVVLIVRQINQYFVVFHVERRFRALSLLFGLALLPNSRSKHHSLFAVPCVRSCAQMQTLEAFLCSAPGQ
jgi:hypothetical protein